MIISDTKNKNEFMMIMDDAMSKEELNSGKGIELLSAKVLKAVASSLSFNQNLYIVEDSLGSLHFISLIIAKRYGLDKLPEVSGIEEFFKKEEEFFDSLTEEKE